VPAHDIEGVVRLAFDAWNRRDLDALLAICEPDVEVRSATNDSGPATYTGHDGVRDWLATVSDDWHPRLGQIGDAGDASAVVLPMDETHWAAARFSPARRLAFFGFFATEADARDAAGAPLASAADVEVVKAIWAEFARWRFPAERFDENIEWHVAHDELEAGTYRGHRGVRRMFAAAFDSLERPEIEVGEIFAAGSHVLVNFHAGGVGRATGIRVRLERTHAFRLAHGRVVEVREYPSQEDARAALGLGGPGC
jgi:ketosteroid isomerase-like protein